MTHGRLVKKLLQYRDMTPAELSRQTGVKVQTIYSIINKNQKRTGSNVYKSLAIALNVPEYIFESSNEDNEKLLEDLLGNESMFVNNLDNFTVKEPKDSDTYLLDLMKEYKRCPEFILNGLKYVSFYSKYSKYDINTLLVNAYKYDVGLYNYIENLIKYGLVVTKTEYHIIEGFRLLDQNEQHLLYDLLTQLIGSHYFFSKDGSTTQKPVENDKIDMMSWTPSWKVDE